MSSSSSSPTVRVDKATSDLLIGPDWTMNIDICDSINSNHWQAKDVVKAVKKRLQHKNPKVQLLSLTLLETMIKNCGDYVHFQIADRNILQEMIKIVKKKTDMQVRDKILDLLDSWQEAFGGPGGKYPQYYWAYEELRRSGVEFPKRSRDAAPIFTPPVANTLTRHSQAGYGMPSNTSIRLDEAMASEMENLSLSSLDSMRSVLELLADMLQAVNPNDREAVKDEIIVDLVSQCRSNQKKLMQMLTSTGDEDLLCQGLALNDNLQSVLVKHDAIASGSPLPTELREHSPRSTERRSSGPRSTEERELSPRSNATPTSPLVVVTSSQLEEEDEEDDDFAKLARRQTKSQGMPHDSTSTGTSEDVASAGVSNIISPELTPGASNALALPDPPIPIRTNTKEQDMIDLLSITLSTSSISAETPLTPPSTSSEATNQAPVSQSTDGYPYRPQAFPGYQTQAPFNNYVAPWAHPQPQSQPQPQPQPQPQIHTPAQTQYPQYSQPQPQPTSQQQSQLQSQAQTHFPQYSQTQPQQQAQSQQLPPQTQYPQYSQPQPQSQQLPPQTQYPQYSYPPPPWATNSAGVNQIPSYGNALQPFVGPPANASASYMPMNAGRPVQNYNAYPVRGNSNSAVYGEQQRHSTQQHGGTATGPKPFVPSYRLFEDLNVLGSSEGGHKTTTSASPTLSGMAGQSMIGGRK